MPQWDSVGLSGTQWDSEAHLAYDGYVTSTSNTPDNPGHAPSRSRNRWLAVCSVLTAAIVLLDQVTKYLVRANLELGESWPAGWELIRISHVRNSGAAFGVLPDATVLLTIASLVASVVLIVVIWRMAQRQPWQALCLSLILAGALGNLIDRARLGYVTDFINPTRYPSFNVADSAITIGIVLLLLLTIFERDSQSADAPTEGSLRDGTTRAEFEAGR